MISDGKINIEIIDNDFNIDVDLECNTENINVNLTEYNDKEVRDLIQQNSQEIHNVENDINTNIKPDIQNLKTNKADKSEIPDVSSFITKDVDNLTYYTLATNTGSLIEVAINSSNYVMTLTLKNADGNVISSDNVDLPLESVVVNGTYDNINKQIILTLQNGNTIDIPVGDLVSGLQKEITVDNKLSSDLVDDTNQTNKFVTNNEKQTWNNKSDFSGNYNDLSNKPTIPDELSDLQDDSDHRTVTDTEKQIWNNKGTYSKPTNGIPKTDLESSVQTSLGKADTALQSISSSDVTTALGYIPYNSSNPNGYTSNIGTITSVKMNGTTISSSGEADLGTIITQHQDISGKLDKTSVKTTTDTTQGNVYDVTYINTMLGNIESLLSEV